MNEVISSILEAEKKADSIIKTATDKAKEMLLSSDVKAEEIKAEAVDSFKREKKLARLRTDKELDKIFFEEIEKGEKSALKIKKDASLKVDKAVDFIVNEIIGK